MSASDSRDDQLGRARVRDNARLSAYYEELDGFNTGALWTVANDIEPWEPTPASDAVIWRFADLRPKVLAALDLVSPEEAGEGWSICATRDGRMSAPPAAGCFPACR